MVVIVCQSPLSWLKAREIMNIKPKIILIQSPIYVSVHLGKINYLIILKLNNSKVAATINLVYFLFKNKCPNLSTLYNYTDEIIGKKRPQRFSQTFEVFEEWIVCDRNGM
jgi:hypothetical protein